MTFGHDEIPCFLKLGSCFSFFLKLLSFLFFIPDEGMDDGTDDEMDGWKGRPDTTASGQNQGYYFF